MTHWRAKLDALRVSDIRALHRQGVSQHKLAWMYGVSQPTIGQIVHNDTWKGKEEMSTKEMPLSIDLNIDRMRAKVYQEMAEVCRPFYKRLEQLDAVEEILKSEQDSLTRKQAWETRRVNHKAKKPRRVAHREQAALPYGDSSGAYARVFQTEAIVEVLKKEPGLNIKEITDRMIEGGFPFKSDKPVESMYVAARTAENKGAIRKESVEGGLNVYYQADGHKPSVKTSMITAPYGALTETVINVIANGPEEGMTRQEVLAAVLAGGYEFSGETKHKPERRITWALASLVESKRIRRIGIGPSAIFSPPKLTPIKHK